MDVLLAGLLAEALTDWSLYGGVSTFLFNGITLCQLTPVLPSGKSTIITFYK
jgi:hypothetical protein